MFDVGPGQGWGKPTGAFPFPSPLEHVLEARLPPAWVSRGAEGCPEVLKGVPGCPGCPEVPWSAPGCRAVLTKLLCHSTPAQEALGG